MLDKYLHTSNYSFCIARGESSGRRTLSGKAMNHLGASRGMFSQESKMEGKGIFPLGAQVFEVSWIAEIWILQ